MLHILFVLLVAPCGIYSISRRLEKIYPVKQLLEQNKDISLEKLKTSIVWKSAILIKALLFVILVVLIIAISGSIIDTKFSIEHSQYLDYEYSKNLNSLSDKGNTIVWNNTITMMPIWKPHPIYIYYLQGYLYLAYIVIVWSWIIVWVWVSVYLIILMLIRRSIVNSIDRWIFSVKTTDIIIKKISRSTIYTIGIIFLLGSMWLLLFLLSLAAIGAH